MTIAGYTYKTWAAVDSQGNRSQPILYAEGSHYGVGPQHTFGNSEYTCPFCGGYLDDHSGWWFGQHLACVQRARQLSTDWAWVSGESEPWPDPRLKRGTR